MAEVANAWPMGAVLSMMDLSVEAEAFGAPIRFFDDDIPTVIGAIIHDSVDAENLKVPTVSGHRTETYVKGIRRAKERIPDRPLIAGVIGPFSISGRLMDMTEIMVDCYMEPERVHRVLEKATAFITDYIRAFKAAGANGVLMAEPAAGLLSPALCEEFSSRYIRQIADSVKDEDFAFFYHNCGNTLPLLDSLAGIGADAYHFGDAVSMKEVLTRFSPNVPVMGNLSPSEVFRKGTPETVRAATLALLRENAAHRNWVLSSGCDIPPNTPLENIDAFFAAVRDFYAGEGSWER
jgi:uroporphyrinogen decarboxylase